MTGGAASFTGFSKVGFYVAMQRQCVANTQQKAGCVALRPALGVALPAKSLNT